MSDQPPDYPAAAAREILRRQRVLLDALMSYFECGEDLALELVTEAGRRVYRERGR